MHEHHTLATVTASVFTRHANEYGNKTIVRQETIDELVALQQENALAGAPDPEELLRAYWGQQFDRHVRQNAGHIKNAVGSGTRQGVFDLGDDYDMTFLVCGREALSEMFGEPFTSGRVVTLGQFTDHDAQLMALEQRINLRRQQAAHDRDQPQYAALVDLLARYGTYYRYRQQAAHA